MASSGGLFLSGRLHACLFSFVPSEPHCDKSQQLSASLLLLHDEWNSHEEEEGGGREQHQCAFPANMFPRRTHMHCSRSGAGAAQRTLAGMDCFLPFSARSLTIKCYHSFRPLCPLLGLLVLV